MKLERKSWERTRYIRDMMMDAAEKTKYGTPLWHHTRQDTIINSVRIVTDIEHAMYLALWNLQAES